METTTPDAPTSEVDGGPRRWPGLDRGVVCRAASSARSPGADLDAEVLNAMREQYHLTDSFLSQY